MKTYTRQLFLLLCFVFISLEIYAQQKQIKVQIMHNDKVVVDTTLFKTSDEAKVIIENLVQRFSTDPVTIDTKLTHGLYVFNITNDSWIDQNTSSGAKDVLVKSTAKTPDIQAEPVVEQSVKKVEIEEQPIEEKTDTKVEESSQTKGFDDIEVDSLFREFSKELDTHWDEAHIDIIIDSVGNSFMNIWDEMKKGNFQNDPDIQNLKNDIELLFEKIITTQIIIIQESDTLKID